MAGFKRLLKSIDKIAVYVSRGKAEDLNRAYDMLRELLWREKKSGPRKIDIEEEYFDIGKLYFYKDFVAGTARTFENKLRLTVSKRQKEEYLVFIGLCHGELEWLERTIKKVREVLVKQKASLKLTVETYWWLGLTMLESGDYRQAAESYHRICDCLDRDSGDEARSYVDSAISSLATCYWKLGNEQKANEYVEAVLTLDDVLPWILENTHCVLGHRFFEKRMYDGAKQHYQKALEYLDKHASAEDRNYYKKLIAQCTKKQ